MITKLSCDATEVKAKGGKGVKKLGIPRQGVLNCESWTCGTCPNIEL